MKKVLLCLLFMGLFFMSIDAFGQCSQCKLLAEQSARDEEILGSKGSTINTAILYIMAVPYIILTFLFRKQIKRFLFGRKS